MKAPAWMQILLALALLIAIVRVASAYPDFPEGAYQKDAPLIYPSDKDDMPSDDSMYWFNEAQRSNPRQPC